MDVVEVPLNSFLYRFRRLSWVEEARLVFPPKVDQREVVLAHALHDVSGHTIQTVEDAWKILRAIPVPLRWRIWILYRGRLPEDRSFAVKGLYKAPDHQAYNRKLLESGDVPDAPEGEEDPIARRFGPNEAREARELESAVLEDARRRGVLRKAGSQAPHA